MPDGIGLGVIVERVHGNGGLLASLTATLGADGLRRGEAGVPIEPAAERGDVGRRASLAGQIGEDGLGDILDQVRVAAHQPQRGGIDQVDVALHQLTEGLLGAALGILAQQLCVVRHARFRV